METGPEPGPEQPSCDDTRPTITTLDPALHDTKPTVAAFDPAFHSALYETFFSHDSPGQTGDPEPFHTAPAGT